mgnify:CR=1 FL=1
MQNSEKIYIEDDEVFEEKRTKKTVRVLVFSLGDESYCVDVREAREVTRMPETSRVPNVPSFVLGVTNFRGEILSVLDLHYFFGVPQKGKTKEARVIVSDASGGKIGLMVDGVNDTLEIEEERIQEPLATLRGRLAEFTKGQIPLGKGILIFLDFEKILECDEIRNLRKGEKL